MTLHHRKSLYSFLALGSFYLALLAVTNLLFGFVILSPSPQESALRIAASLLGLFGFVSAWATIICLPVWSKWQRIVLAVGILSGFCSLFLALAMEYSPSSPLLQLGFWRLLLFSYIFGGTCITGLALLVELALGPNNSFKPTPLRGAA